MIDQNVKPLTFKEWSELKRKWGESAGSLMQRAGSDPNYDNGGHRVRQNPVLVGAIKEIRDEYFTIFNQFRSFEKQKHIISVQDAYIIQNNIEFDLLVLSRQSFEKLQQFNYGLTQERAAEVLQRANVKKSKRGGLIKWDDPVPLSSADAESLLRAIVGISIRSFGKTFSGEGIKYYVPNLSLKIDPKTVGLERLPPPNFKTTPSARSTGLLPS